MRELRNVIEQAVLLTDNNVIDSLNLSFKESNPPELPAADPGDSTTDPMSLNQAEINMLIEADGT